MADERDDAHLPHHREGDESGTDFRPARHVEAVVLRGTNGTSKALMIIGSSALSILLAVSAFLLGRDRTNIDRDINRAQVRADDAYELTQKHEAVSAAFVATQAALAQEVADLKKQSKENADVLRTLLVEVRKR